MRSILFVGSDIDNRKREIDAFIVDKDISERDTYRIENSDSVKIGQIRALTSALYKEPAYGTYRAGIVYFADKLTLPAQNAFLKLLEEPPNTAYIILGTTSYHRLLPTVVSRCRIINIPATKRELKYKDEIKEVLDKKDIKTVFENAQKFGKNKLEAEEYLGELLFYIHEGFITSKGSDLKERGNLARQVNLSLRMLSVNVNPRQVLENLFL